MSRSSLHRVESAAKPLSFAQERLWFLDQINPGDPSASVCRAFRLKGELKPERLKQSMQAVVNRHESLRTTFATTQLNAGVDSKPVQLIATEVTVDVALIDLSLVAPEQRELKARDLARAAAQRPFDLTLGPLLRTALVKLDDGDHVLILHLHRIICDEQSVEVLVRDLGQCYMSDSKIASLPIQFSDYAEWQQESVNGEQFKVHADYWK